MKTLTLLFIGAVFLFLIISRIIQKIWNWLIDYNPNYTIDHFWIFTATLFFVCIILIFFNKK